MSLHQLVRRVPRCPTNAPGMGRGARAAPCGQERKDVAGLRQGQAPLPLQTTMLMRWMDMRASVAKARGHLPLTPRNISLLAKTLLWGVGGNAIIAEIERSFFF